MDSKVLSILSDTILVEFEVELLLSELCGEEFELTDSRSGSCAIDTFSSSSTCSVTSLFGTPLFFSSD